MTVDDLRKMLEGIQGDLKIVTRINKYNTHEEASTVELGDFQKDREDFEPYEDTGGLNTLNDDMHINAIRIS